LINNTTGRLLTQFDGNFSSTTSLAFNSWHHVVYVFDKAASEERWYIDGAAAGAHVTTLPVWNAAFALGAYDLTHYMLKGGLTEVAVYPSALSAARIEAHHAHAVGYPATIFSDEPVAYWRLGESGAATTAVDEQGAHDGSYVNQPLLGQAGVLSGSANTAVSFDGVSDYVAIPNPALNGSFTLEAWVYATGPGSTGSGEYSTVMGYDYTHRLLINNATGRLLTQFDGNFFSTIDLTFNAWHHVVYVFDKDAAEERLFLDGAAAGTHATTLPTWNADFKLGAYDLENYMFKGSLDEVALYPTALTLARIQAHDSIFVKVGHLQALGGILASRVGPGPAGTQRYYLSINYPDGLDLVSIDPGSGSFNVYAPPVAESTAWAMTVGADAKLYLGTAPSAHLLQFNPDSGQLIDLGRPAKTESYVWDLTLGSDNNIYGGTFPEAKLVRYRPATGVLEDLGTMADSNQEYAHYVAAAGGYVYVGLGTTNASIAAYEIATGAKTILVSTTNADTFKVAASVDGFVYGTSGHSGRYRLSGLTATPVTSAPAPVSAQTLADGRTISVDVSSLDTSAHRTILDDADGTQTTFPFAYPGKALSISRLGLGPDGQVYGSGFMPGWIFEVDPSNPTVKLLGQATSGEVYSFLSFDDSLHMGVYAGSYPIQAFNPSRPFNLGTNPWGIAPQPSLTGWRPQALVANPDDGKLYYGGIAPYGQLGGPLVVVDPATRQTTVHAQLITDESVCSLAVADGKIVGGTSVEGGGGATPTQTDAALFIWDPATQTLEYQVKPVANVGKMRHLVTAPNGNVYGFADSTVFVFDPRSRSFTSTGQTLVNDGGLYNSFAVGPDGNIYGATRTGIYVIDVATNQVREVAAAPAPLTAGFVLDGRSLYIAAGADAYRFSLAP
jgi:hypothetical protein